MNIYLIINHYNRQYNIIPYYYIGSDTRDRDEYMSSSKWVKYDINLLGEKYFSKTYLWTGTRGDLNKLGYKKLVQLEQSFHESLEVKTDDRFYNIVDANNKFTTEGKAVFKKADDFSITRLLPTNHPLVITGEYIGYHAKNKRAYTAQHRDNIKRAMCEYWNSNRSYEHRVLLSTPKREETKQKMRKPKSETAKQNMRNPKSKQHREKLTRANKQRQDRKVIMVDLDGTLIREFESIKDAAHFINPNDIKTVRTGISCCCRGIQKTAYGYKWRYYSESTSVLPWK